jgi:hypothetical protein
MVSPLDYTPSRRRGRSARLEPPYPLPFVACRRQRRTAIVPGAPTAQATPLGLTHSACNRAKPAVSLVDHAPFPWKMLPSVSAA